MLFRSAGNGNGIAGGGHMGRGGLANGHVRESGNERPQSMVVSVDSGGETVVRVLFFCVSEARADP